MWIDFRIPQEASVRAGSGDNRLGRAVEALRLAIDADLAGSAPDVDRILELTSDLLLPLDEFTGGSENHRFIALAAHIIAGLRPVEEFDPFFEGRCSGIQGFCRREFGAYIYGAMGAACGLAVYRYTQFHEPDHPSLPQMRQYLRSQLALWALAAMSGCPSRIEGGFANGYLGGSQPGDRGYWVVLPGERSAWADGSAWSVSMIHQLFTWATIGPQHGAMAYPNGWGDGATGWQWTADIAARYRADMDMPFGLPKVGEGFTTRVLELAAAGLSASRRLCAEEVAKIGHGEGVLAIAALEGGGRIGLMTKSINGNKPASVIAIRKGVVQGLLTPSWYKPTGATKARASVTADGHWLDFETFGEFNPSFLLMPKDLATAFLFAGNEVTELTGEELYARLKAGETLEEIAGADPVSEGEQPPGPPKGPTAINWGRVRKLADGMSEELGKEVAGLGLPELRRSYRKAGRDLARLREALGLEERNG